MRIEKEDTVIEDTNDRLVKNINGITCGCGNPQLQMFYHSDGVNFYTYQYKCMCGNTITVTKRREETEMW